MHEVTLKDILAEHTKEGELFIKLPNNWVQCFSCGHRCKIPPEKDGICKIRFNRQGTLFVPHGYVSGIAIDPIEKKPFFHAYPGLNTLSFGMLGGILHRCPQEKHCTQLFGNLVYSSPSFVCSARISFKVTSGITYLASKVR